MSAEMVAAMAEMKPVLAEHPAAVQERAIALSFDIAIRAAGPYNPNAAGGWLAIVLELVKVLLPLILELIKGE